MPSSSLQFQRQSSIQVYKPRAMLHPHCGVVGPPAPPPWISGRGAGMWVCVTAWQETQALPAIGTCMCLHDCLRCALLLSRSIELLRLLGLQIPTCKTYPKGQLSPLPLNMDSWQSQHSSALGLMLKALSLDVGVVGTTGYGETWGRNRKVWVEKQRGCFLDRFYCCPNAGV